MLHINVASLRFGDGKTEATLPDVSLYIATDTISLRDLIARSVEQQINTLIDEQQKTASQAQIMLQQQYIDNDTLAEQVKYGKVAMPGNRELESILHEINVAKEIERATHAFKAGQYKIYANGRECVDLNESIPLNEDMKINFVRLMPLVGG